MWDMGYNLNGPSMSTAVITTIVIEADFCL